MNIIYNAAVNSVNSILRFYSGFLGKRSRRKFSRFVKGQQGLMAGIEREMAGADRSRPTVWFHASSLGEYGVARPLIDAVRRKGDCNVVLTFFSPSGYEALRDRHPGIDHLFYLPLDTASNARRFIEIVKPDRAVFMISEFWPNYLQQLKFNSVPTYLVSAIIRDNSQFFRWYGKTFRKALSAFSKIYVLNNASKFNLRMLGYENVTVCGDALFDNAALVASTPWHDETIKRFASGGRVFVAGSISDSKDLELVSALVARHPDIRFILVPHETDAETVRKVADSTDPDALRYTQCTPQTDITGSRVLIIDCIGKLAYLYRYGTWAYVGGGFTPLLHSVIEATVYGLPVAFGPCIERKVTPQQISDLGLGRVVTTPDELDQWLTSLKDSPDKLEEIKKRAAAYVDENCGATEKIVTTITAGLWERR